MGRTEARKRRHWGQTRQWGRGEGVVVAVAIGEGCFRLRREGSGREEVVGVEGCSEEIVEGCDRGYLQ